MMAHSEKVFEFENFRVDLSERQLLHDGKPVALTPKAFDVLALLIERRGHLVERGVLIQQIWANTFVEEANLTRTVWMLRQAFNDKGKGSELIQTVPKLGYRFVAEVTEVSREDLPDRTKINSFAVMPLHNSSGDPSQEYLADGVTEGLIATLSRAKETRLIAPKSVMAYKGTSKTPSEIAKELNVDAAVQGTFTRNEEGVQLDLQLVSARGEKLWSGKYAGNWSSILYLETDAANEIARQTRVELRPPPNIAREVNPYAYDLYLQARYRLLKESKEETDEAISLLEQAVKLDPQFANAYAELGRAYNLNTYFFSGDEKQWAEKAYLAAERANQLSPDLPEAHLARGLVLWRHAAGFRHEQAVSEYKRALELNPNYDEARHQLGIVYHHVGLFDKAMAQYQLALAINPANNLIRAHFAGCLNYQQKYEDALVNLAGVPYGQAQAGTFQKAFCLVHLGRYDEAAALAESSLRSIPTDEGGVMTSIQALIAAHIGDERGAEELIERSIELGCVYGHFHHAAYNFGAAYAILNKPDLATKWLQIAADDGFPCYPAFANDQDFDNIRHDPGFKDFLSKQKKQWEVRMKSY